MSYFQPVAQKWGQQLKVRLFRIVPFTKSSTRFAKTSLLLLLEIPLQTMEFETLCILVFVRKINNITRCQYHLTEERYSFVKHCSNIISQLLSAVVYWIKVSISPLVLQSKTENIIKTRIHYMYTGG